MSNRRVALQIPRLMQRNFNFRKNRKGPYIDEENRYHRHYQDLAILQTDGHSDDTRKNSLSLELNVSPCRYLRCSQYRGLQR